MGVSLRNRLERLDGNGDGNNHVQRFVECVGEVGPWEALRIWEPKLDGYRSYEGVARLLVEEGKDENFGLMPRTVKYNCHTPADALSLLSATFASSMVQMGIKFEKQEREIASMRMRLQMYEGNHKTEERQAISDCLDLIQVMETSEA